MTWDPIAEVTAGLEASDPHYWAGEGVPLHVVREMVAEVSVEAGGISPIITAHPSMLWSLRFAIDDAWTEGVTEISDRLGLLLTDMRRKPGLATVAEAIEIVRAEAHMLAAHPGGTDPNRTFYGASLVLTWRLARNQLVVFADPDNLPHGQGWHQGCAVYTTPDAPGGGKRIYHGDPDGQRPEGARPSFRYYVDTSKAP